MLITNYQPTDKPLLAYLLRKYYNEVEGEVVGSISDGIDMLVQHGRAIYLLTTDDKPIGFVILYCNDQCGMSKLRAVVEYMYLLPAYRRSTGIRELLKAVGSYCIHNEVDCVIPATTTNSVSVCKTLGGDVLGNVYTVPLTSIKSKYKDYT